MWFHGSTTAISVGVGETNQQSTANSEPSWMHQRDHDYEFIDGNDDAPVTKQQANDYNNSWSLTQVRLLLAICGKRMWSPSNENNDNDDSKNIKK